MERKIKAQELQHYKLRHTPSLMVQSLDLEAVSLAGTHHLETWSQSQLCQGVSGVNWKRGVDLDTAVALRL